MKIVRSLAKAIALSMIIMFVILVLNLIDGDQIPINATLLVRFGFIVLYTICLSGANWAVFRLLDRHFTAERFSSKRIIVGFLFSFIASLAAIFLLRIFEEVVIRRNSFTRFIETENAGNYVFAIVITFIISLSLYLFHFYRAYHENKVKQQQIIAGTASAKFETLKNQIDPHFLFNSLNVLSSLIEENPEKAQKFTSSLSKIYRYVLEQKDKELIDVGEELSFAKTYVNLLRMRFEDSVSCELPGIIPNPEAKVVPLSLQLLLENTIKHNIVSEKRPLKIRIYFEGDYLVVENDLQKREALGERRGVGLQNIVSRYAIITRRQVIITESEKAFTVKIPILTRQIEVMETLFNEEESSYLKAQKRVEDLKGFYGNLGAFIFCIGGLAIFNIWTSPQYLWFVFPALSWGVGVLIHTVVVFGRSVFLGRDWEERKIREFIEKEKTNTWK